MGRTKGRKVTKTLLMKAKLWMVMVALALTVAVGSGAIAADDASARMQLVADPFACEWAPCDGA